MEVVFAVRARFDGAEQHFQGAAQIRREQFLLDAQTGKGHAAAVGAAHHYVALSRVALGVLLEEPVHVHAQRVADAFEHRNRQARMVAL